VGDLLHLELLDRRFDPPVAVSAADVGFGVSQLLPLVVQLVFARDQIVCIEQPEIHLHPRLQSEFAELLIESTSAEGRANQVVVETHSEHLMLRLQRKVRAGEIAPADISVLYVDINEARGTGEVRRLRLDDRGRFLDRWPGGFFDERFAEIFDPETLPTLPAVPDDDEDEGPSP
jgi:predicted ATPase